MPRSLRRVRAAALLGTATLFAATSEAQIYTRKNSNGVIEATNVPDEADFRLTYPGKGTLIHSRGFRRVYSGQYDADIDNAASVYGVRGDLIRAVIAVESEFDQYALSSKGAQGLMQLMPGTARRFGVTNAFDSRQNIFGGVQYLRFLLDLFSGDIGLALAGYNAGENAVLRHKGIPPYKETQGYVRKIQGLLRDGISAAFYAPRWTGTAVAGVMSYTPKNGIARTAAKSSSRRPASALRPRTYYKYRDGKGVLHVGHVPPAEGVLYTTIRAFD